MNLRNVLRAYSLLRQLSDDESALLNILRTLNDNDREQLVASMSDKPGVKTRPQSEKCGICNMTRKTPVHSDKQYSDYHLFEKKSTPKKSAGKSGSGKSKHASSLAEKVGGTLASIAKTVGGDDDNARKIIDAMDHDDHGSGRCQAKRSNDRICMLLPDHNIHHMTTANEYHEFVAPPTTGKSDAQSAAGGS